MVSPVWGSSRKRLLCQGIIAVSVTLAGTSTAVIIAGFRTNAGTICWSLWMTPPTRSSTPSLTNGIEIVEASPQERSTRERVLQNDAKEQHGPHHHSGQYENNEDCRYCQAFSPFRHDLHLKDIAALPPSLEPARGCEQTGRPMSALTYHGSQQQE